MQIDKRGDYYDTVTGEKHTINQIGIEPDSCWTRHVPFAGSKWDEDLEQWVQDIESIKEAAYKRVNVDRLKTVESGIEWNGHTWDSDETSRNNLIGIVVGVQAGLITADPETGIAITWRTADNQDIDLTVAELLSFAGVMLGHVNAQYQKSWDLKKQINSKAAVEDIAAIVWA